MDKIKIVIGLVVIGVLAFFFMGNRPQITDGTSCKNCNVIVVGVDTLRADHMSAIGYNRNTTPTLDAIAKEGALFSQAVAPAS